MMKTILIYKTSSSADPRDWQTGTVSVTIECENTKAVKDLISLRELNLNDCMIIKGKRIGGQLDVDFYAYWDDQDLIMSTRRWRGR